MDMTVLIQEIAKAGLLPLLLCIVIYVLWKDNIKWRDDYNAMRDKMQDKIDAVVKQATDAINATTNQSNSLSATLASVKGVMDKFGEQLQKLSDDILRNKGGHR